MAKKSEVVHLTEEEAKKGICEKCGGELVFEGESVDIYDRIYICKVCRRSETFHENGKRREASVWSRYL